MLSGIAVKRVLIGAYALMGVAVALTGFMTTAYSGASTTTVGDLMELDAIAACVIGGTALKGGRGTVWGVMEAFGAVALEPVATVQTLAPGVAGALLATVAGLLVAIPSLMGYNYLFSRVRLLNTELENYASSLADRIELESR